MYAALALPLPRRRHLVQLGAALGAAIALYLGVTSTETPSGLAASYWPGARASGAPERSTEFPWLTDATRIDTALELHGEDFGVYFFNDASRFNFGADQQPGRDQLPFSMRWNGWLSVQTPGPRRFGVDATGPAHVVLDGAALDARDTTVQLTEGLHPIQVDYTRPEAKVPTLRVRWQAQPGGELVTLGGAALRWRADAGASLLGDARSGRADAARSPVGDVLSWLPTASSPVLAAFLSGLAVLGMAAVAVVWLTLGFTQLARARRHERWWRGGLGGLALLFLVYGMALETPLAGKATILSGPADWLIYESSARELQ